MHHQSLCCLLLVLYGVSASPRDSDTANMFTECSEVLDQPKGIMHTPNFPQPFPAPISCQWLIKAPPNKKIILYFTQFYVRLSFFVAEFDYYKNDRNYSGMNELGEISFEDILTSLVAYKPYVLVRFMTTADISNIHLRVDEYLLDVHGFNITYEIVDRNERVRKNTCSVHDCSFLGNCLASKDFSSYVCQCFPGYFGSMCQYGPYCDPERGINMCKNGGQCRYLYGSLVNTCECPPDFEGTQCQYPKAHVPAECTLLGCSQKCTKGENGRYQCGCDDGYKLANNNVTCVEEGRFRVVVGVLIHSKNNSNSLVTIQEDEVHSKHFMQSLKKKVSDACNYFGTGVCDISHLGISSFRNTTGGYLLEFYFYCEKSDIQKVENGIRILVSRGAIESFIINQQYLEIRTDPALHLLDVKNYDKGPAVEGKLLTLVCTARGSKSLHFRWFKDGVPIRTHLTKRNEWEQRVPATIHEMQLAILNIENVSPLDKGEFTCEVIDYNEVANKSLTVEVIQAPVVEVNTLSASLIRGEPLSLNCLSPGDTRGSFKYAWFRNNEKFKAGENEEVIEDLLPTGVRLTMRAVAVSANYSCWVTNEAGKASLTISVYVLEENRTSHMCGKNKSKGILWVPTAPGGMDEHRCPKKSGGFAKRYCRCDGSTSEPCEWSRVNFAGCKSDKLTRIVNQIKLLLIGYQHSSLPILFDAMDRFVNRSEHIIYKGDLRVIMETVHDMLDHSYTFKAELNNSQIPLRAVIRTIDRIIAFGQRATEEELKDLQILPSILRVMNLVTAQDFRTLSIKPGERIKYTYLDFINAAEETGSMQQSSDMVNRPNRDRDEGAQYRTIAPRHGSLYVVELRNVLGQIPLAVKRKMSYHVVTDLALVLPEKTKKSGLLSAREPDVSVFVTMRHKDEISTNPKINNTICIHWETLNMYPFSGVWNFNNCVVDRQDAWWTHCRCKKAGIIAVAVLDKHLLIPGLGDIDHSCTILQVACILAVCGLAATLILHLICYRYLQGDIYSINISFVFTLIAANIILLCCLNKPQDEIVCIVGRLLLYFFYLASFAFLLAEALYFYLTLNKRSPRMGFCFRYFLLGWGLSSVFITCVVAVYVTDYQPYERNCEDVCWVARERESSLHQFLAMIVPVCLMIMVYMILSALNIKTLIDLDDVVRQMERRQLLFRIGHTSAILVLLLASCITKTYIDEPVSTVYIYVFLVLNSSLGFSIFIFRCMCDEQIRRVILCSKGSMKPLVDTSAQSSLPRPHVNSGSILEYMRSTAGSTSNYRAVRLPVSRSTDSSLSRNYCKRKEHLRSLLGTGTLYNEEILGGNRQNYIDPQTGRDTYPDSGIFEGSESEKMSSASNSLKEKGLLHQAERPLCRRSLMAPTADGSGRQDGHSPRRLDRLSKCSNNSSSNETLESCAHVGSDVSGNRKVDTQPQYRYTYSEVIVTNVGVHYPQTRTTTDEEQNEVSTLLRENEHV